MRILANENFPLDAVVSLRSDGHDVWWVRSEAPGITDREVLRRATSEDRLIVTFDKDFRRTCISFVTTREYGNSALSFARCLINAAREHRQ
ncbi:MAG TPA: DUF5615 family PIN-like protein [Pyrinomonadaceae bacterium]|nr:DUF5615 family PIN-like protein [Pyrinomonadaceae bacterium]